MIEKKEVEHIAKLAKLGLDKEEEKKMAKELSLILDYFKKLKKVDVSNIEPTSHNVNVKNVKREDESSNPSPEKSDKLLEKAPNRKGRYVKVRAVFK